MMQTHPTSSDSCGSYNDGEGCVFSKVETEEDLCGGGSVGCPGGKTAEYGPVSRPLLATTHEQLTALPVWGV